MQIYIDIEDASGNKYGDGPITTAVNWTSTRRLDAAGSFSFTMPASDPVLECSDGSPLLQQKRFVYCYSIEASGVVEHGAGIIESLTIQPTANGPTMLVVAGDDLLRELVYRTVGELDLFTEAGYAVDVLEMSYASGATNTPLPLPASVDLDPGPVNFLNIGYHNPFGRVDFTVDVPNTIIANVTVQYENNDGQTSPTGIVNTTTLLGAPFGQSGYISFDIPTDWQTRNGYYQIRVYCNPEDLEAFTLSAVSVSIVEAIADGLQRIMALCPPGWSLDPAGAFATETDVYMQFSGESILTALVRLAEQTGEHFRLSASGRRVEWLGSTIVASGLRAIASSEVTDDTMLIVSLSQETETWEMYNRLYCYGGGSDGNARLTLADTARSAPSGFTLSKPDSYIENNTSQATYGRIDRVESFSDIIAVDSSTSAKIEAANSLFDRGLVALKRASQLQTSYSISVIPSLYRLFPGPSIRVIYHEWVDGYHSVNIDATLTVLEVQEQIGVDGVKTSGLTVATVDTWPIDDSRAIARSMGDVQTRQAVKAPQTGLSMAVNGAIVGINIENGMVVNAVREKGLADGKYPRPGYTGGVDSLTLRNGQIVAINDEYYPEL